MMTLRTTILLTALFCSWSLSAQRQLRVVDVETLVPVAGAPFGTGTSISYNYIDYRVRKDTANTYQLRLWVDDEYLCGELRAAMAQPHTFHIHAENEYFSREAGVVYRNGEVYRDIIDRETGKLLESQLIRTNHARVMYDLPDNKLAVID